MKNTLYLFAFAYLMLAVACGSESEVSNEAPKTLDEARKVLKEKRRVLKTLRGEISDVEAIIAKLDPNANKKKEVPVTVAKVTIKDFNHFVEVQGNVVPAEDPGMASSETGGRIVELKVKEGQYVKKGDLIAKINLESIKKSIAQLDESLSLAQDIFKRQENLWKQKIGSEVQFLQAKSQVESLLKNKESMEYELTKANVYAPISGYVDMVMAKEGEMAGPGAPIVQILNTQKLKVVAAIPEIYLGKVKRGESVLLKFPALKEEQKGRVMTIGRIINPANRTFEVEAAVNSRNGLLKPNLLATMLVNDYEVKDAIVVPDQLILQDVSGADYVMVLEGNKAVKKVVKMGKGYNNETIIKTGLTGEETLLIKGARQVSDGDWVKVLPE
ncbi:efflux RND transporter periplasmic adaptor subunit [Aureispira anguillae]|uniref:Efflux RND transporter periplasmic adaptor subunit n=1 Tax=Aureispira anguillae TaxID=2864201 RepID=A0A915YKU4_9BACT|nr:efflux RND transporter periplasmic adaptor subunit [Aureispira anguillae]BDS14797.1 efflux RND transporter periplasmic adaptor subunit [Aureispira anguillae]